MGSVLVPDLDDELMWALVRVEELLLTLAAAEQDPLQPVRLPPVVAGGRALRALARLYATLAPTQSAVDVPPLSSGDPSGSGAAGPVWAGADGRRLRALALVEPDPADLTLLSRTATSLGYELALRPGGELARMLVAGAESVAELSGPELAAPTAVELVASLARVLGLLDLAGTDDTARLTLLLHAPPPARLDLTRDDQDAHRRTLERMGAMWGIAPVPDEHC